jgi:hypothetical protein
VIGGKQIWPGAGQHETEKNKSTHIDKIGKNAPKVNSFALSVVGANLQKTRDPAFFSCA